MSAQELAAGGTAERRISTRHPCTCTLLAGHEPCVARVYNLSREGMGFFIGHELTTQGAVAIELYNATACVWYLKGARVIHATAQADGSWLIGVAFLHTLAEAELQSLI